MPQPWETVTLGCLSAVSSLISIRLLARSPPSFAFLINLDLQALASNYGHWFTATSDSAHPDGLDSLRNRPRVGISSTSLFVIFSLHVHPIRVLYSPFDPHVVSLRSPNTPRTRNTPKLPGLAPTPTTVQNRLRTAIHHHGSIPLPRTHAHTPG